MHIVLSHAAAFTCSLSVSAICFGAAATQSSLKLRSWNSGFSHSVEVRPGLASNEVARQGIRLWLQVLRPPLETLGQGGALPRTLQWRVGPMSMMAMALHLREELHPHMQLAAMLAHPSTLAVMTVDT